MFVAIRRASPRVSSLDAMSAIPPKAGIFQHGGNVRFVPKAGIVKNLQPVC
jgi:hypothetical protein